MVEWSPIILLGLAVGTLASVLGLGGGVLLVPLLPMVAPLSQRETIGTSLFTIFLVVTTNTLFYHRQALVEWRLVLTLTPAAVLGAFSAARLTAYVSEFWLKSILGLFLCLMALRMMTLSRKASAEESIPSIQISRRYLLLMGVVAGAVSGFSGIGAGLIVSSFLLYFHMVPNIKVSPSSNAVIMFTTFSGAMAFATEGLAMTSLRWGVIHLDVGILLYISAFLTAFLGRKWQHHLPMVWRRRIISLLLSALGLKVLISTLMQVK